MFQARKGTAEVRLALASLAPRWPAALQALYGPVRTSQWAPCGSPLLPPRRKVPSGQSHRSFSAVVCKTSSHSAAVSTQATSDPGEASCCVHSLVSWGPRPGGGS